MFVLVSLLDEIVPSIFRVLATESLLYHGFNAIWNGDRWVGKDEWCLVLERRVLHLNPFEVVSTC